MLLPYGALLVATTCLGFAEILRANEQAAVSLSKLIMTEQVSACDGEQLSIKCDDDYTIDVLLSTYTILSETHHQHHHQDSKVSKVLNETAAPQRPQGSGRPVETCPPMNNKHAEASAPAPAANNSITSNVTQTICDERQAQLLADPRQEPIRQLVKTACQGKKSCQLELQLQPTAPVVYMSSYDIKNGTHVFSNQTDFKFNEVCPVNRKLLEVAYKCRPRRMKIRNVCRGSYLDIECPANKRILIPASNAHYGWWANESTIHNRCRAEQNQLVLGQLRTDVTGAAASAPLTTNGSIAAAAAAAATTTASATPQQDCHVQAVVPLHKLCLGKQRCRMDIQSSAFEPTNCSPDLPHYLKVIYTCADQAIRITPIATTTITTTNLTRAPLSPALVQQLAASGSFAGGSDKTGATVGQRESRANADNSPKNSELSYSFLTVPVTTSTSLSEPDTSSQNDLPFGDDRLNQPTVHQVRNSLVNAIASNPVFGELHPKQWSPKEKVAFLFARYQYEALIFGSFCVSILIMAFVAGSCRGSRSSRNSRNSSNSSTGKNSANGSSKSFNSTSNSIGTATTIGAGNSAAAAAAHLKHNSCSESCFSLDDYHLNGSSNHSPALDSVDGSARFNQPQQQPQQQQQWQVRPRLWNIYGSHEQAQQQLRNTLRPNRTFLGQQHQMSQQQQQQQQPAQHIQSLANQQTLLLALAANQQQQATNHWCATLHQQHHQQHHHHHQQQQFQSKQFSVLPPPPPNLQLELTQTTDLVIPVQQMQQQPQQQQQQVNQFESPYFGGLTPPAQGPQT